MSDHLKSTADFIAHAQAGHLDALGQPMSAWRVARRHDDGRVMRDAAGRQLFETQAEWLARHGAASQQTAKQGQQELFA